MVVLASPESHSWIVTILRGGRCRWVRRAFFRWWKSPSVRVYLCPSCSPVTTQPAPMLGPSPHSQLPCGLIIHPTRSRGSRAQAGRGIAPPGETSDDTSQGSPYRRPLSCAFRLCSNRAASLKDTLRPVELVDRKRSVSASSPLNSGSARRAKRGWAPGGPSLVPAGCGQDDSRGRSEGGPPTDRQGPQGGRRALAHPLTHSLAQHAPVSTYAWALRKQR